MVNQGRKLTVLFQKSPPLAYLSTKLIYLSTTAIPEGPD